MHLNGQNRKKFRKRTLIIFQFYMKMCLPTFSGGPQGWESDIISKNSQGKKLWHISKFSYGSYRIFGMVRMLVTKKVQALLEAQCEECPKMLLDKSESWIFKRKSLFIDFWKNAKPNLAADKIFGLVVKFWPI